MTEDLKNIFTNKKELASKFSQLSFPTKKTEEWIYTNPTLLFEGLSKVHASETVELPKKFEHQLKKQFHRHYYVLRLQK